MPRKFSTPARSPPLCATLSRSARWRRSFHQNLGRYRRRRRARSRKARRRHSAWRATHRRRHRALSRRRRRRRASAADLGAVAPEHGVEAVTRLLDVMAKRGRGTRARDVIAAEGADIFRSALAGLLLPRSRSVRGKPPKRARRPAPLARRIAGLRHRASFRPRRGKPPRTPGRRCARGRSDRIPRRAGSRSADDWTDGKIGQPRSPLPQTGSASSSAPTIRAGMSSLAPARRFALRRISHRARWRR